MRLIYPDPSDELTPLELVEQADLPGRAAARGRADRPYLYSNFAVTLNGLAAIDGRSGAIGSDTDTEMLMALRYSADAVLVGAGTVRDEQYGQLLPSDELKKRRSSQGRAEQPLAVVLTGSMDLPWEAGLFSSGEGRVLIATSSDAEPAQTSTPVDVMRFSDELDLAALLKALQSKHGISTVLCEGGPSLHADLIDSGLIDEMFVTLGNLLGPGEGPRLTSGLGGSPRNLELVWLAEASGELFSRYRLA